MNKKSNMYFVQLAEFTIIWGIMSNGGDAEALASRRLSV